MQEYFAPNSKFGNRLDYIYETLSNGGFKRNNNNLEFHPKSDTAQHTKDWLGSYALISDCFAYFGKDSRFISPNILDVLPKGQENKHYDGNSPNGKLLLEEVSKQWNFRDVIQNKPHDTLSTCNSGGCGKHESNTVTKGI